jgi:hypothetical protein
MKTLLSLLMMALVIIAGSISFEFFTKSDYSTSALLTLVSIVAIDLSVYVLSNKKASA